MKPILLIFFITLSFIALSNKTRSENTKSKINKFNEFKKTINIKLLLKEKLIIKKDETILIIAFKKSSYIEKNKKLIETGKFDWIEITNNEVKSGSENSTIVYQVNKKNRHLKKLNGNQLLKFSKIQLKWSYNSDNKVWIYLPPNIKFTKIRKF